MVIFHRQANIMFAVNTQSHCCIEDFLRQTGQSVSTATYLSRKNTHNKYLLVRFRQWKKDEDSLVWFKLFFYIMWNAKCVCCLPGDEMMAAFTMFWKCSDGKPFVLAFIRMFLCNISSTKHCFRLYTLLLGNSVPWRQWSLSRIFSICHWTSVRCAGNEV